MLANSFLASTNLISLRMIYRKFNPSEVLVPFVECYFYWSSEGALQEELMVESPPTGYCSIVFNNGDGYFLQNKKYERLQVPRYFISGQSIYTYRLFLSGTVSIIGIVFKPAALGSFFGLPTFEFTEERVSLQAAFPAGFWDAIIQKINSADEAEDKIKTLDSFLLQQYKTRRPQPDYIDKAVDIISEKNGLVNVAELMNEAFVSRRTFERNFFQKVGLSPKYYARIRRFGYICKQIAGKKKVNWSELLYDAEYYDQSHFIKDFEEFTGRSPEQYLKENNELVNFVEKPNPRNL